MIRVGVDAWNLPHDRRGIGRYVRALVREFSTTFAARIEVTLVVPEWPAFSVARRYRQALPIERMRVISRGAVDRAGLDLLWFPFNGVSWERFALPAVATLHDASTFELPGFTDADRMTFVRAAARCEQLITDSQHAERALTAALGIEPGRISAIALGVAPPLPTAPPTIDPLKYEPFVLFVGELEARKGLDVAAAAVAQRRDAGSALRLVTLGRVLPSVSLPEHTIALGHVDDATLAAFYRAATAFMYPSRYEGFGLPVLEAMSYGTPVVASNVTGIPDAAGDAALLIDPLDVDGFAHALERIEGDPDLAAALRSRGLARAADMTWKKTAAETLGIFEAVLRYRSVSALRL